MFKVLTFMFFHAGMKLNADVAGSWLWLREHDVKQRAWLVKVNRSQLSALCSSFWPTAATLRAGGPRDVGFGRHGFGIKQKK